MKEAELPLSNVIAYFDVFPLFLLFSFKEEKKAIK